MDEHHPRRRDHHHGNRGPSNLGADEDMNAIDVDQIMIIPDTPDRVRKQQKVCEGAPISALDLENSTLANEPILERRDHHFGDGMRNLRIYSHRRGDLCDSNGCHPSSKSSVLRSTLRNTPSTPAVDSSFKLNGKQHVNHHHGEDDEFGHFRFPEKSRHYPNRHDLPVFDRGDKSRSSLSSMGEDMGTQKISKACFPSKSNVLSRSSVNSSKSSREGDKGKLKIGNDKPASCDAYTVSWNDEAFHVASELSTGSGSSLPPHSVRQPAVMRKRLVRNGCISPHNIEKTKEFAGSSSDSSLFAERCAGSGLSVPSSSSGRPNPVVRKMFVRNGCISPHNIENAKKSVESSSNVSANADCYAVSGLSQNIIDVDDGIGKGNAASRSKGKEVLILPSSSKGQENGICDTDCSSDRWCKGSTMNNSGKNFQDTTSSLFTPPALESVPQVCTPSASVKRLKTPESSQRTPGENKDVVCLSSGGGSSAPKLRTDRGRFRRASGSPIIVGDSSPEVRDSGPQTDNDVEIRTMQLEVDEMLARELQEQLYNEIPEATISEEVPHFARGGSIRADSSRRRRRANDLTGVPASNTRRAPQVQSLRYRAMRRGAHARLTTPRMTRFRNQINHYPPIGGTGVFFPPEMDIDMRMELLEALEAVAEDDIRMVNQLFAADREFGENDYEMLLALDENNHEHLGASVAQIGNLPESTVRSEDSEVCSICLDNPTVGDIIRHLPCLHKFHKDCIDPWLRRKRSCPVCKSDIV